MALLLLAGCGDDSPPAPAATPVEPRECSARWRVVFSPQQQLVSVRGTGLTWHDGRLYFKQQHDLKTVIRWVPVSGGPATTALETDALGFWLEDDRLVCLVRDALQSVPLQGGTAQTLVRLPALADPSRPAMGWALERQAFYWVDLALDAKGWTLWRWLRDGSGDPVQLAAMSAPGTGVVDAIVPLSGQLIVGSFRGVGSNQAWAVPREGGEARPQGGVVMFRALLGVSPEGEILWRNTRGDGTFPVTRSRLGNSEATPFWTSKPPQMLAHRAAARDRGAWFVAGWEAGADNDLHSTVWSVDAEGHGTRLACDPEVEGIVQELVVAPDGLYAVVEQPNLYWQIVAILPP
jgi:hypothetical protein